MNQKQRETFYVTDFFSTSLFWDVQLPSLNKHRDFIIARVLDEGNEKDVENLWKVYTYEEIKHVVKHRKNISSRSVYFWAAYFGIPFDECVSLKR